jgi:hypothetical protein
VDFEPTKHLTNTEYGDIPKNIKSKLTLSQSIPQILILLIIPTDGVWSFSGTDLYRTIGLLR